MEPQLENEYLQTGLVAFTFRFFPVLGPDSVNAADAAACAAVQNKFWPYHDLLYENYRTPSAFSPGNLQRYAGQAGLDTQAFAACLSSGQGHAQVAADMAAGTRAGVRATPTIVINGQVLEGLHPLEDYRAAINQALSR